MYDEKYLTLVYDKEYDYKILLRIFKECNIIGKLNKIPVDLYNQGAKRVNDYSFAKALENISKDIMRGFENLLNGTDSYICISCENCGSRQGRFEMKITYEKQRKSTDHMFHLITQIVSSNVKNTSIIDNVSLGEIYIKRLIYYCVICKYIDYFNFFSNTIDKIRFYDYNFFKAVNTIVPLKLIICEENENNK